MPGSRCLGVLKKLVMEAGERVDLSHEAKKLQQICPSVERENCCDKHLLQVD